MFLCFFLTCACIYFSRFVFDLQIRETQRKLEQNRKAAALKEDPNKKAQRLTGQITQVCKTKKKRKSSNETEHRIRLRMSISFQRSLGWPCAILALPKTKYSERNDIPSAFFVVAITPQYLYTWKLSILPFLYYEKLLIQVLHTVSHMI